MNKFKQLFAVLALLAPFLPLISDAQAAGIPDSGVLSFTVMRKGAEIGTHTIRFKQRGGELAVDIATDINVKIFLGISVYHFKHQGQERWRDGALVALASTTDDDGAEHQLQVLFDGGALKVESGERQQLSAADIMPASLWNVELVKRGLLLNTLDGREMRIYVAEQGLESIEVMGDTVEARHYVVSGGLERELWYDAKGVLVQYKLRGNDDSEVLYVLN